MRILIVHPVMAFLGGGERLCCETIRALLSKGHEVTFLSGTFDPRRVEDFFGYHRLFTRVNLMMYPLNDRGEVFGTYTNLIQHLRGQAQVLKGEEHHSGRPFDVIFSTQDPGYIPDMQLPVVQWGYFPKAFSFPQSLPKTIRVLPLRLHYERKISRIGLVLAISEYSKTHLDNQWRRPSILAYPACNMVSPVAKRNLIVTAARAVPEKRLDLFWTVARLCPQYEFAMLLTQEPHLMDYPSKLSKDAPDNGTVILNPPRDLYHRFLSEAKVYLHLMPGEHFGITIVEAMSASCVPVVHDSGGPREIVSDQVGFRWQNLEDIPTMIDEAISKSPSEEASRVAERFSVERFEKRLSSIFSELQARNPRPLQ